MEGASLARQVPYQGIALQRAATATGTGTTADASGLHGAQVVELLNTGTGNALGTLLGSYDGVNWYGIRYAVLASGTTSPVTPTASPVTTIGVLSIAAAGSAGAIQLITLIDYYPKVQFSIGTANAGCSINATLHALPV
jgi:hypothetical protein